MEDTQIIELYFQRSEDAVSETKKKYGAYCNAIVCGILHNPEDSEECLNDAYLKLWNTIPPVKPRSLKAYVGRIVRNSALSAYERLHAVKRGSDTIKVALDELAECIPDSSSDMTEELELQECLEGFLRRLPKTDRIIFLRRYWYMSPIKEIAEDHGLKETKVVSVLRRTRNRLKRYLEREGMSL